MLNKINLKQFITITVVSASSICSIFADIKPAFANCNIFGCSRSSAAQCNPFGCPKAPAGESCTPFGCPESPQSIQNQTNPSSEQPNPSYEQPNPSSEVNPQALRTCLETLLYRTEVQKPFPAWICVPNDVNCKTVKVRTEISENVAVQACQGSR